MDEAKRCGSLTAFGRDLPDDHRTLCRLPQLQIEILEADMKVPKLTAHRDYARHLRSLRLQGLLEQKSFGRKPWSKR